MDKRDIPKFELNGELVSAREMAEHIYNEFGCRISPDAVLYRRYKGWTDAEIAQTPVGHFRDGTPRDKGGRRKRNDAFWRGYYALQEVLPTGETVREFMCKKWVKKL